MDQLSFASLDFAAKKKRAKRDVFLAERATVVPWTALEGVIEPHLRDRRQSRNAWGRWQPLPPPREQTPPYFRHLKEALLKRPPASLWVALGSCEERARPGPRHHPRPDLG